MMPSGRPSPWLVARSLASSIGLVSLALVTISLAMMAWALFNGVHCVECDRHHMTPFQADRWTAWFAWKWRLLLAGGVVALVAFPIASRRRWAGISLLVACIGGFFLTLR